MAVMATRVAPQPRVSCDTRGDIGSEPPVPGSCRQPCPPALSPGVWVLGVLG